MASPPAELATAERIFDAVGGGLEYTMRIPEMRLQFTVSRIHRNKEGMSGDLLVQSSLPGARTYQNGVVLGQRFNLSSAVTRLQVAKVLADRIPISEAKIDYYGYLEDLCQRIADAEHQGNPILEIGTLPPRQQETLLLDPLLAANKPTIIFGDGGVGKSMLAVSLAISVRLGLPVVPGVVPTSRGQVLYLDWETDEMDMDARVKMVSAGVSQDPVRILYRYCARPLYDGVEEVARIVRERDVALVVIDSAAAAIGTSHEGADAAEGAIRFFAAIRLLGCTALVLDHVAKVSAQSFSGAGKPYGSTYKVNLARSTWEMRQASGTSADGAIHTAIYHRKSNVSALHPGMGLALHFEPSKVWWQREAIEADDLIGPLPLAQRIESVLEQQGPMEVRDIVDAVGSTRGAVSSALNRHPDRFAGQRRGLWALVDVTRPVPSGTFRDAFTNNGQD